MMRIVEEVAWNYDPAAMGYAWDEEVKQDYQRHFPKGTAMRCYGRSVNWVSSRAAAQTRRSAQRFSLSHFQFNSLLSQALSLQVYLPGAPTTLPASVALPAFPAAGPSS